MTIEEINRIKKMNPINNYKGSASNYIKQYIIPNLPHNNVLVNFSDSLNEYLSNQNNKRIIRKFRGYKFRGIKYEYNNMEFLVSDNEAALWIYMQAFNEETGFSYIEIINNEMMPIAYAIKRVERERGLIYMQNGRKQREKEFSQLGYKHCHIFQCSPRNKNLNDLNLNQRMIRLLNPMNHFPFPSPKKYEMPIDYGEDEKFLSLLLKELIQVKYSSIVDKANFEKFIKNSAATNLLIDKVEDFDIVLNLKFPKTGTYPNKKIRIKPLPKQQKVYKLPSKQSNANEQTIKSGFELRSDFKINLDWVGQNRRFAVRFNRGNHQNQTFYYDHDEVYKNAKQHLENLDSFKNYGYNVSTSNIPKYAKGHLINISIQKREIDG